MTPLTLPSPFRRFADILGACLLALPLAVAAGAASWLFVRGLGLATQSRLDHPWLLYTLPLFGLLTVALYRLCDRSGRGNNLIIDEIHAPGGGVPLRLAPLIVVATWIAHLGGASVGREGTAVQMGGGLAGGWARLLRLDPARTRVLLQVGIAAGFGGVFGTPLAASLFAMEVLTVGTIGYAHALPCLVAAYVADLVARGLGTPQDRLKVLVPDTLANAEAIPLLLGKCLLAGAAFGLAAALFVKFAHAAADFFKKRLPNPWVRVVVGAGVIIALTHLLGTRAYLGLGTSPIPGEPDGLWMGALFVSGGVAAYAWFVKLAFTGISLGCGFRGGEVAPLFLTGALLGNALAVPLGLPVDLCAAMGFVALFAAATKTPVTGVLLGLELFAGATGAVPLAACFALACFTAYHCSGRAGVYAAQRDTPPAA